LFQQGNILTYTNCSGGGGAILIDAMRYRGQNSKSKYELNNQYNGYHPIFNLFVIFLITQLNLKKTKDTRKLQLTSY